VQFEPDPIDGLNRVAKMVANKSNGYDHGTLIYIDAIQAGLASDDALSELLPPPQHSEKLIRIYLAALSQSLKKLD
jgi:hypothetical protein